MRVPLSVAPEQRIERVLDLNLRLVLWKLRWRINGVDEGEEEEEKEDEKKRDCEEASGGAASIEAQCSRTVAHSSSRVCVTGWEKNVSVEGGHSTKTEATAFSWVVKKGLGHGPEPKSISSLGLGIQAWIGPKPKPFWKKYISKNWNLEHYC